ncbi:hypothetical protein BSKO_13081 [Bryopsis sp. KO-2023]|nr:hypothetical protein BSKO_13081 [Bryopsis sp. KO-2023]
MWEARRRRYGSDSRSPSPVWYRSRSRSRERGYARDRRRTREKDRSFSRSRSRTRSRSRSSPRSRGVRDRSRSRERSERHERRWVHDRFRQLEEEELHHEHQRGYDAERSGRDRHDSSGGHMRNGRENSNSRFHRDSYYDDLYDDRCYGGRDSHPRSGRRLHRYSDDDYDDDWDRHRDRGRSPYRRGRREEPCSVIYLKGVPLEKDEGDLYKVFEGLPSCPKIESIRIMRDRITGQSRGFAFVDFASVDDARKVMDGGFSGPVEIDGCRLHMEYSSAPLPAKPSSGSAHLDWVCNMCGAVNFARRLECYQCCAPRAKDAQRVSSDPDGPSCILKVSGLEQQTSEDSLYQLFAAHVPVKEIRMVLDKFTSAPRGFAFVHFHTVADASRMLNMFQGHVVTGQQLPLKVCFARDRLGGPLGKAANAAAAAVEAAHAMQQYSSWEPKEFDQEAVQVEKKETSEGPPSKDTGNEQDESGYQYDPASGYYYHSGTGFYFDANTGMYFDNHKQQWLMYDHETKEYAPYSDEKAKILARKNSEKESDSNSQAVSTAAQNAVESTNAAVEVVKGEHAEKGKTVRRKGATIGAAPQLNPEGLLAAAKAEQEQKLLREAAARRANFLKNRASKQKNKKSGNKAPPPPLANTPRAGSMTAALSRITKRDGKGGNPADPQEMAEEESLVANIPQPQPAKRVQGVIRGGRWGSGAPGAKPM